MISKCICFGDVSLAFRRVKKTAAASCKTNVPHHSEHVRHEGKGAEKEEAGDVRSVGDATCRAAGSPLRQDRRLDTPAVECGQHCVHRLHRVWTHTAKGVHRGVCGHVHSLVDTLFYITGAA